MEPTGDSAEHEMMELPESWKTLPDGTPTPNWVAAVDEARRDIDLDPAEAAERLRGMFSDVAPGVSLSDELIGDRRAEVEAEERAEAERPRAND